MASSAMSSNWGYSGFSKPHTWKQKEQNVFTIFTRGPAFHACLSLCSGCSTYAPDESRLFWLQEQPNTSNLSPCKDKDGTDSGISWLYLWSTQYLCISHTCIKSYTNKSGVPNYIPSGPWRATTSSKTDAQGPNEHTCFYVFWNGPSATHEWLAGQIWPTGCHLRTPIQINKKHFTQDQISKEMFASKLL